MDKNHFLLLLDQLLQCDPGSVKGDEVLVDMKAWDSLAVVEFIALTDERLGIQLGGDDVARSKTIGDLLALVGYKIPV